jgi:NCS1 family nucleobase:cation symporter-1
MTRDTDAVCAALVAAMRVWSWSSFFFLWICNGYGAGGWSGGASLVVLGLTVPQAIGISVVATLMTSTVGVLAGVSGTDQVNRDRT